MFVIAIVAGVVLGSLALLTIAMATIVMKREDKHASTHGAPRTVPAAVTRRLLGLHIIDVRDPHTGSYDVRSLVPPPRRADTPTLKAGVVRW